MQETTATNNTFNALAYAMSMADEFGLTLDDLPPEVTQASDRAAVNKLLMQLATAKTEAQAASVDQNLLDYIKTSVGTLDSSSQVQQWQHEIESRLLDVSNHHNAIISKLRDNARTQAQIDSFIHAPPPDVASEVLATVKALGWTLSDETKQYKDRVIFTTPVIPLVFKRPEAGLNYNVPLGPYKIFWNVREKELYVQGMDDNVKHDGYFHPHVNSDNSVCWGNGYDAKQQALGQYKLLPAATILDAILRSYNPESPYVDIIHFAELFDPLARYGSDYELQRYGNQHGYYRAAAAATSHNRMMDAWNKLPNNSKPPLIQALDTHMVPGQTERNSRGTSSYKQIFVPLYRVMHKTKRTRFEGSPYFTKIGDKFFKLNEAYEYGKFTVETTPTHEQYLASLNNNDVPF